MLILAFWTSGQFFLERAYTLLVFAGRYSLHRVSPIAGSTARLVALLGYDTKPGTMSSDLLKEVRYGRTS